MGVLSAKARRMGSVPRHVAGVARGTIPGRRQRAQLARVFDPDYYTHANPDVLAAGIDPWHHYVEHGYGEGRLPRAPRAAELARVPRRVPAPSGPRVTVYTSINLAYLDRALVLAESLAQHHPDWHRVVVLVEPDHPTGRLADALRAFDEVIVARDLYDESFDSWIFGLSVVEACTAVKGPALAELLARDDCDLVLYMDPDTWVLRPMDGVVAELADASAVLTPHILEPATTDPAVWDGEVGSLKHGVYNLGFLGVRDCPEGHALARWWAQRLHMACWDDPQRGLFTDQKWMNLAPVFFPGTRVLRDPGLNVASWNLNTRRIDHGPDGYLANGQPVTFFHFTKAETVGPEMTSLHASEDSAVGSLWEDYLDRLRASRAALPEVPEWGYARFHDGTPIAGRDRIAHRQRPRPADADPFTASSTRMRRLLRTQQWWAR